jgi:hypothetical protein
MDTGYHLYTEGCMAPSLIRYVVYRDGQFQVIGSWLELQEVFAPIESPDEALSFAIALTGYSAYYGLEVEPGLTYFVDTLEDTHVVDTDDGSETPGGYRVHLFYYELCGCGPHDTVSAKVFVTRSGQISSVERESVFKDPQDDGLCID